MKTVKISVNLFDFNELNDEAKEKAKEFYLNINSDAMQEDFIQYCIDILKEEYGFKKCPKIAYSLSYSQGDGLCFYGNFEAEDFDEIFFKKVIEKGMSKRQKQIIENELNRINFDKVNHFYAHSNTVNIYVISNNENYKHFKTLSIATKNVENWFKYICRQLEEDGYKFFYEIDENDMVEFFKLNDIMFKENGDTVYLNDINK